MSNAALANFLFFHSCMHTIFHKSSQFFPLMHFVNAEHDIVLWNITGALRCTHFFCFYVVFVHITYVEIIGGMLTSECRGQKRYTCPYGPGPSEKSARISSG